MIGFEIAGIVLAVMPLVIEGAKAFANNTVSAREALRHSKRDKKLREFYDHFYWETFELRQTLESFVRQLPHLSETRKEELLQISNIETARDTWSDDPDISQSLNQFFASENDRETFFDTLDKVFRQFYQLVDDNTLRVSKDDVSFKLMYTKMKKFEEEEASGKIVSGFLERFKFARHSKRRDKCLQNLHIWNKRVSRVVDYAIKKAKSKSGRSVSAESTAPSIKIRELSRKLFRSLSRCWNCGCIPTHDARVSLATCGKTVADTTPELWFHFLVGGLGKINNCAWHEVIVSIRQVSSKPQGEELQKICDAINIPQATDSSLQVLVEDAQQDRVWRLNPKSRQIVNTSSNNPRSFKSLLMETGEPGLLTKRKIALTFAYSILQLHGSPLQSTEWDKDHIYFFWAPTNSMDYEHPFLETTMNRTATVNDTGSLELFHPNPGVLKLAILLVELHFWKPIETFREEKHLKDGNPTMNTDLLVLKDLLEKPLSGCFETYSGAIEACVDYPWGRAGSISDLEDNDTWNGVYSDVIIPLRQEVEWGEMAAKRSQGRLKS